MSNNLSKTFGLGKHKVVSQSCGLTDKITVRRPQNAETHAYRAFITQGQKPSVFVDGAMVDDPSQTRFLCPRCGTNLPVLDHGDYAICGDCNLKMEMFGAGLTIWD